MLAQLNKQFQFLVKTNKDPDFKTENALGVIVKKKPYRILSSTSMTFKVTLIFY